MATLNDIMTRDVFTAKPGTGGRRGRHEHAQEPRRVGGRDAGADAPRHLHGARRPPSGGVRPDLTSSPVSEWMTQDPVTVDPETDADEAAEMMLAHGFRHLPVLEGNALVGIVSLRDILSIRIARPR